MTSVYAQRRARLAAQLGDGGIAIIPTAAERGRNRDNGYLFRHDSYFYYLTGFTEPHACLVLKADGSSTLFCQPKDLEREIWDGYRLGPQAAVATLGMSEALSWDEIDQRLPRLLENQATVWWPFATHEGWAARVEGWLGSVRARTRAGALCPSQQGDVCTLLDEMRLIKDAHELAIMRRAGADQRPCPHPRHAAQRTHAACRGKTAANTTWMPSCCTNSAKAVPKAWPMTPSSPPGRTPACCTTAPTKRRCAAAIWC